MADYQQRADAPAIGKQAVGQGAGRTPGPWRHDTRGNFGNVVEAQSGKKNFDFDEGWRAVATVQECCASDRYDDQEANKMANIRLIAAAPEMLEALLGAELAVDQLCIGQHPDNACWGILRDIHAAIRKATGAA